MNLIKESNNETLHLTVRNGLHLERVFQDSKEILPAWKVGIQNTMACTVIMETFYILYKQLCIL